MSRFWCSSGLGLALVAGCLLPEGSIDPNLPDELAGIGGSSSAGGGGAAGSNPMGPGGMGGSGGVTAPAAGAGGGTGGNSTGVGGAEGGTRAPRINCTNTDEEAACAAYCTNYEQSCGDFPAAYTYTNLSDCLTTCTTPGLWPVGVTVADPGSIFCRCFHATLALNGDRTTHCFHAAEDPSLAGGCAPLP
jgi:hypothetical protein